MRRRVASVPAVVAAVCVLAACTGAPRASGPVPVGPSITPSIPSSGPVRSRSGPHVYQPGASSLNDPLDPGAGNGGYDVAHYALSVGYDPGRHWLTSDALITAFATQDLSRFNLDFRGLTITGLQVDGSPASYSRRGEELQVTPGEGIDVGTRFTVRVNYEGVPDDYAGGEIGREGFIPSGPGAIVQGEPSVAASWFPVNDHPRDKATYEINLTVPSDLQALSNGLLAGRTPGPGGTTTWHWVENQPMASYLATAMIGKYRVVTRTDQGRPAIMAVDSSLPAAYDAVLNRTPDVVDFLETQFGRYPFDAEGGIIHADAGIDFALENQSRPVYAPGFFANDSGRGADLGATSVLAHELAHQWYGDSVSVADWRDIWLNEGFATYAEWLWSEHEGGASPRKTFDDMYKSGKLPTEPPGVPTRQTMFDSAVYDRGAATLEALRISVGDAVFFRIVRGWAVARAYGNASTGDFIAYAERVSGKRLDGLFRAWLFTPGLPPYPAPL